MKSVKINQLKLRDEEEVAGYHQTLQIILDNYASIKIAESDLHQLPGILLKTLWKRPKA